MKFADEFVISANFLIGVMKNHFRRDSSSSLDVQFTHEKYHNSLYAMEGAWQIANTKTIDKHILVVVPRFFLHLLTIRFPFSTLLDLLVFYTIPMFKMTRRIIGIILSMIMAEIL